MILKLTRHQNVPFRFSGCVEWPDGLKAWYLNGLHHRPSAPAIEHPNGARSWWLNGERHRTDGPAYEGINGCKEYWVHNKHIEDITAFKLLTNMLKLKDLP